jgi:hypothetical protein
MSDDIIRLAREVWSAGDAYIGPSTESLQRFAALVKQHLVKQGYRKCAEGQKTTQFCGMLAAAVKAEREACAEVSDAWDTDYPETNYGRCIAAAIRERGGIE